jgi:hypothetical protein
LEIVESHGTDRSTTLQTDLSSPSGRAHIPDPEHTVAAGRGNHAEASIPDTFSASIALARWLPHQNLRLLVITGFLGGYTTFSTFEYDSATLWERGETRLLAANIVGSVVAGFVAVLVGIALARSLDPSPVEAKSPRAHVQEAAPSQSSQVSVDGPPSPGVGIVSEGDYLDAEKDGRGG